MATRWEIERGLRRSSLRPSCRHIARTMLEQAEPLTGVIPQAYSPSLTTIARWTGYHRSTIKRGLRDLARDGWVKRTPPPRNEQLRGAVTAYAFFLPLGLGASPARPGRTVRPELGASGAVRRAHGEPQMFNPPSDPSTGDGGDLAAFVIAAVRGHTGKTITKLAAAQGIERTLAAAGGPVRDPRRYLAAAISRDPAAWLPGPSIPSYAERMAQLERLRESGDEDDH